MHPRQPRRAAPSNAAAFRAHGMHGLGDNIHQRAIVRQLMARAPVWLETTWPCVYHDLVGPRLQLSFKGSPIGTYRRNAERERAKYSSVAPPADAWPIKISYTPTQVRSTGSVLAGMCAETGCSIEVADFRLPLRVEWADSAARLVDTWRPNKPLLIYRPLVERSWWGGCIQRNPEHAAYSTLLRSVRDDFFVISVADLWPGEEWIVGHQIDADVTLHAGELDFETLAALTARASMVFTSPGFAVILAQAVGTPACVVFGGYEDGTSFAAGARFTPYLPIEPITPCRCFSHHHPCMKAIDIPAAQQRLRAFADVALGRTEIPCA